MYMQNSQNQNELKKLEELLVSLQINLSQAKQVLTTLLGESHADLPGIEGIFNGVSMVTSNGQTLEVPVNYAAKSRLVCGDTLKMIKAKEDGSQEEKTLFKQVIKVTRKKVEGVLSKKDGKWYLLTESNSYRVLDRAAEFNNAEQNDFAVGLIPENNLNAPYVALDLVKKQTTDSGYSADPIISSGRTLPKAESPRPKSGPSARDSEPRIAIPAFIGRSSNNAAPKKPEPRKPATPHITPKPGIPYREKKEFISDLTKAVPVEDDDLR